MKIERLWAQVFGTSGPPNQKIKSTELENAVQDSTSGEQYKQSEQGYSHSDQQNDTNQFNQQFTQEELKKEVQKALKSLNEDPHFVHSGLTAKMVGSENIEVEFSQQNGSFVKSLTAEEFLKLRLHSEGESTARGKILDQKF